MAAPKIGILGQSNPGAAANADLYTVPAGRRAVISTLVAAEQAGAAAAIRIFARINGAAAAVGNAVAYDVSVAANSHNGFTQGWTFAAGDIITIRASTAGVTFTLFGEETDVPAA